jgi:hypothetical protein
VSRFARGESTIEPAHSFAYAANAGWIDMRGDVTNGAAIGQFYCTGYLWSASCGWISLGNGPTNGWRYSNASAADWGINHDGSGRLEGFAYGGNVGWVVFDRARGRPCVDLSSGVLGGYLYGANVGWISLSNACASVRTISLSPGPDTDADGIPDAWEMARAGNLTTLGRANDADRDGAPDAGEYIMDTHPLDSTDRLCIASVWAGGDTNRVVWRTRPTRLYRLEATNALGSAAGSWADAGGGLLGPLDETFRTQTLSSVAETSRFYRVKAVVPLSP